MKRTKRPKKVKVEWVTFTARQSKYTCPSCKTQYHGFVSENTTRFICRCGQELIVENGASMDEPVATIRKVRD